MDDTKKLLQECNSGCKMAISSMDQLVKYVNSSQLKVIIEKYKRRHEDLKEESEKLLETAGADGKEPGVAASAFSWISTEVKLMINEDDKKIAQILMDGCNMGIQSICKIQNACKNASKESISLAERLVKEEEGFAKEVKAFL